MAESNKSYLVIWLLFLISFFTNNLFAQNKFSILEKSEVEFTSSNLPIIIIDTHGQTIVDPVRIVADMGIIYNGPGERNYITNTFNDYNGRIAIELRGSASLWYPKKQYRFETQYSSGNNLNVSLLGLPSENDWIFYAPYDDQSLIRNVLAYKLSNDLGRYAARTRFCELILNGDYRGLYVLTEKIKRDRNRVNISQMDSLDTMGDSVTGGYIIKIDKWKGENLDGWRSSKGTYYQYHYPKADQIVPEQKTYIQNFMEEFEMVMDGTEYAYPENGYPKYIDVESFVYHFILNEFCKNVDAYRISAYMYKDRDSNGGKLIMGPIWDFNLSLGKAWFPEDLYLTEGWQVDYNSHRPWDGLKVPFWWEKLSRDSAFVNLIEIRWRELRTSIFQKDSLYSIIDLLVDSLAEARVRNFEKWPETEEEHTYEEEIQLLKQWISDRTDWINENLDKLASVQVSSKLKSIPEGLTLEQNFPNPFNPITTIQYGLPEKVFVNITVYNALGQKISTLVNETKPSGFFQVQWDASSVGSGIYFYMIQAGDFKETKKCLIIK